MGPLHVLALTCLCVSGLVGSADAAYPCSVIEDCNYDRCANTACTSTNNHCNNGRWDHACRPSADTSLCYGRTADSEDATISWWYGCDEPPLCANGTYSLNGKKFLGDGACKHCLAHSDSPSDSTTCTCNAGFSGPDSDGGTCTQCVAGKYKVVSGSTSCESCPDDSNSPPGSIFRTACVCNAGFSGPDGDGGNCAQCDAGKYKAVIGSTNCESCRADSDSPARSILVTACTCNTGFSGLDGGACTEWVAGKHKIAPRNAACSNCLAGQYSTAVGATSDVCQQCPPNSDAPEASDEVVDCSCKVGSSGQDGGACTKCVANSFKADSGDANCFSCPANSNSPEGSAMCKCNAGFSGLHSNSMCTECVSGKYNAIVGNAICDSCPAHSNSPMGSITVTTCTCNMGFSGLDGGQCTGCLAGKYKENIGTASCDVCPEDSDSPRQSTSSTACTCNAGYSGPSGGSPCSACDSGLYQALSGSESCDACEISKYSIARAVTSETSCKSCPLNEMTVSVGSASPDNCDCIEGYSRDCVTTICTVCFMLILFMHTYCIAALCLPNLTSHGLLLSSAVRQCGVIF